MSPVLLTPQLQLGVAAEIVSPDSQGGIFFSCGLSAEALEHQCRVLRSKRYAITKGRIYIELPTLSRHVVEIALRIGVLDVYRRRREVVLHRHQRRHYSGSA